MKDNYQYIIIGAGVSGLQMGYFMQRAGLDYLILEKSDTAGAFFQKFPIHRKLISINKRYNYFKEDSFNMRHDWNSLISDDQDMRFTKYTDEFFPHADTYHRYLNDFAVRWSLNIAYNSGVEKVSRAANGTYRIRANGQPELSCQVVLIGLGAIKEKFPADIEGMEHVTPYSRQTLEPEQYINKRIAVLGGGNSAFETADYLAPYAAYVHLFLKQKPKMAWDTHFVGDIRAVNNNIFDLYQLKSLHAVLNPRIRKIEKLPDGTLRTTHEYDYPESNPPGTLKLTREYDMIISCTGWKWVAPEMFDESSMPATRMNGKFLELNPTWESANRENMYFMGGAMQSIDRKAASGFIHGFRYNVRTLFHLLHEKYNGVPYPSREFSPFDWNSFLDHMYERFSIADGLFQLYGFLADVFIMSPDKRKAVYLNELPRAHAESMLPNDADALILTLEFGFHKHKQTSLEFLGPSDPNDTNCAAFLHPVIRHYHNGALQGEFHFGDSLLARWDRPHESGGAVMSYHDEFQRWASDALGLNLDIPVRKETNGAYFRWNEDQIREYMVMKAAMKPEFPCS